MIAEIIEAPISSAEQYDQLRQVAGAGDLQPPPGAILHIAGPKDMGGWQLVTVWDSPQSAASWGEKIRAAREQLGVTGEAKVTRFEVHNLMPDHEA